MSITASASVRLGAALAFGIAAGALPATAQPSGASDTRPYDERLLRLSEILGAVHYLRELCGANDGQAWRDRMRELTDAGHRRLVLNLEHVSYIDSVGIGEIVRCFLHTTRLGGALRLCGVGPRVGDLLRATQLDTVLPICESLDGAAEPPAS